jgi:hypothetical protein
MSLDGFVAGPRPRVRVQKALSACDATLDVTVTVEANAQTS